MGFTWNEDKPIQARSNHQIGDMYIHKKHKFVIRIIGRGGYAGRACVVVKGTVPEVVMQRVDSEYRTAKYAGVANATDLSDDVLVLNYTTCALVNCFTKLKAGQVLFG